MATPRRGSVGRYATLCITTPRPHRVQDPVHVAAIGVAHMRALQNRSALTGTGDYFVQLSQVTRHLLGFHGAQSDLPHGGVETISPQWLYDQQAPVFRAFMVDGAAEGVMCVRNEGGGGGCSA